MKIRTVISTVLFVFTIVVNLCFASEQIGYIISEDFIGHPLVCQGQCHHAQSPAVLLGNALGIETNFMPKHMRMASEFLAQDGQSLATVNGRADKASLKSIIKKYMGDDEDDSDNSCEEEDCTFLQSTLNCSDEGTHTGIGFVPLLSMNDGGYIFARVSSGISGLRDRYFSLEGEGGRAGYTVFVGSPNGAPTTVFAVLQPTRIGSGPKGSLKFLIEQALISSPTRDRVGLKSKLYRSGKFINSECEFDEDTPFRPLPNGLIREIERDGLLTANENFKIDFGRETNITSVEVTLGHKQCMAIVLSTAPPCCVVNVNIPVSHGGGC